MNGGLIAALHVDAILQSLPNNVYLLLELQGVMRYFLLALETGDALSDAGMPVVWATCPDLPGAYEEAPTADEVRERLRALAHHIIAEHIVREDPLDPAIIVAAAPPPPHADTLIVAVSDADVEAVRAMPLLLIEQPEP